MPGAVSILLAALARLPQSLRRRTSSGAYRPEIDGLRFIAIAVVVAGHLSERALKFGPAEGGPLAQALDFLAHPSGGVLLFFAISGFIIVSQFRRGESFRVTGPFLASYFKRRALRIEPPYLLLLVATYLLIQVAGVQPPNSARFHAKPDSLTESLVASLLYAHAWFYGALPRLFPPGWSLEVEIQFYLIAPWVMWAYLALNQRVRGWAGSALLAASIVVAVAIPAALPDARSRLTIPYHMPFFWLGSLLAAHRETVMARLAPLRPAAGSAAGWAGLALFVASGTWADPGPAREGLRIACEVLGALLMFAAVLHPANSFRRFCSLGWISLLGGACYSLYLTHLQVLQTVAAAMARLFPQAGLGARFLLICGIGLPLVLAVGLVFYALIERFFMRSDWPQLIAGVFRRPGRAAERA